jgi:SAM-dependent methyltransferase
VHADVAASTLDAAAYDLAISSLVACHLPDLGPLYAEAARLVGPRTQGRFVLLDFHPFFLLNGIPTHFPNTDGEQIAIENTVHLMSDHVAAAAGAGWWLVEMHERLIDHEWVAALPNMERYAHRPISFVMVWERRSATVV